MAQRVFMMRKVCQILKACSEIQWQTLQSLTYSKLLLNWTSYGHIKITGATSRQNLRRRWEETCLCREPFRLTPWSPALLKGSQSSNRLWWQSDCQTLSLCLDWNRWILFSPRLRWKRRFRAIALRAILSIKITDMNEVFTTKDKTNLSNEVYKPYLQPGLVGRWACA